MMRFLLILISLLLTTSLFAVTEVSTQIHDIDLGQNPEEETLIFLTSGQVVTLPKDKNLLLKKIKTSLKNKTWLKVTFNEERELIAVEEIPPQAQISASKAIGLLSEQTPYNPSILKDMDTARSFFYDAKINRKDSQCYNRAHVWSYDWRLKKDLYSSKVWLFFTKKFIRKYKFDWWFHVAPMVHVVIDGQVKERLMDIKYARGPIKLKAWTDIFMRDSSHCPVIQNYSDYADYPESASCYVMKTSMYYYQPVDLEQLEVKNIERDRWNPTEVRQAFLEAFEITL